MEAATDDRSGAAIPKKRQRHHSYDESVDEPAKLIETEPVDIEAARPLEENEPIEDAEDKNDKEPPAFEE